MSLKETWGNRIARVVRISPFVPCHVGGVSRPGREVTEKATARVVTPSYGGTIRVLRSTPWWLAATSGVVYPFEKRKKKHKNQPKLLPRMIKKKGNRRTLSIVEGVILSTSSSPLFSTFKVPPNVKKKRCATTRTSGQTLKRLPHHFRWLLT